MFIQSCQHANISPSGGTLCFGTSTLECLSEVDSDDVNQLNLNQFPFWSRIGTIWNVPCQVYKETD